MIFLENRQGRVDFEGFMLNGYHHVNQRIFLHRLQWGKIYFDDFLENLQKIKMFDNKTLKSH